MKSERMLMMNVVGKISDMDNILMDIVNKDIVQFVDANDLISHSSFLFPINDENVDIALDFNFIERYKPLTNIREKEQKLDELNQFLNIDLKKSKKLNTGDPNEENIKVIFNYIEELKEYNEKITEKERLINTFYMFRKVNINLKDLENMKNFKYKFGVLSKDDRFKIKRNYENIFAAIFHLSSSEEGEVYLFIYPTDMEVDINRNLKSLNFQEMFLPQEYEGTPFEIIQSLDTEVKRLNDEREDVTNKLDDLKNNNYDAIKSLLIRKYNDLNLENFKNKIAVSDHYFYMAGWIGNTDSEKIKDELESKYELTIQFNNMDDGEYITPPTKLKNNFFFKPFELLVKMYGTPNYNEIDPTAFFAITYMILFGAMFGDVGQGLIFILGGFLVSKAMNKEFGGLLKRLGLSSIIFGFIYGSFFGMEDIIPALIIRPYENINTILIMAIILGVILLFISYGLGIYNLYKEKNIEELAFGEKGITGFILYMLLLMVVVNIVLKVTILPISLNIVLIIIAILLMVFKRPLVGKIMKKKDLYGGEKPSGYYIEGSFSIIETLISIFSGTISFIRVGAFAINHVGLFLAFSTIGKMMGSSVGNIIMMIFGNILIIGLEGLIVFIQSLRLEYYEMFSKYYKGDGVEFIASKNRF